MRLSVRRARRPAPLRCGVAPTVMAPLLAGPVIARGGAVTAGRSVVGGVGGGGAGAAGRVSGAAGLVAGWLGEVGGREPSVPGPPPGVGGPYGGPLGGSPAVAGRCVPVSGQPTGAGSRAANPPWAGRSPSLTRCSSRLVRLALGFGVARHRDDGLLVGQVDQAHAHSLPAGPANLLHPGADHAATRGDREDLLVDLDDERSDQLAALGDDLRRRHALAATTLDRVLLDLRPLRISAVGRDENVKVVTRHDLHGEQLVALEKRMPMTPLVARPIGRSASSLAWNRIDCACLEIRSRSLSAATSRAAMTSSSSRRLMPTMPPERLESKSVRAVFFTSPCLVARTRYGATA